MAEASTSQPTFANNERCLCYHGPLIYEAKILKTKDFDESDTLTGHIGTHYFVHYKGWKQTWDEYVPASRLLKFNDQNLALQKSLNQAESAANKSAAAKGNTKGGRDINANVGATAPRAGRKDGARGQKRGREEDESSKRPDMKLTVPELLKVQLVDDWEAVTKSNQLVPLPRSPNVTDILDEFETYVLKEKPPGLRDPQLLANTIISGLRVYFDRSCGANLLYRAERPQYAAIRKKYVTGRDVNVEEQKDMSALYGAEHLLRMLVTMPQMVMNSSMDGDSVGLVKDYVNELLKWMEHERKRIFLLEYEVQSPAYQNVARS